MLEATAGSFEHEVIDIPFMVVQPGRGMRALFWPGRESSRASTSLIYVVWDRHGGPGARESTK